MSHTLLLSKVFDRLRIASPTLNQTRCISVSATNQGKRNFKKFSLGNKRGSRDFKQARNDGKFPDLPVMTDVKPMGYKYGNRFIPVPEMIPEFVVPDLTDCKLKPYVSYRTPLIVEEPFTPQELFNVVYKEKIESDYKNGKILADGRSEEESEFEKLTPEEAAQKARITGSDIFSERTPKHWEFLDTKLI